MQVQPYLFFDGHCEEAVQYYQKHLDAKVNMLVRYKEAPSNESPAANYDGEKIMYCNLNIGDTVLMVSDSYLDPNTTFKGFSLSLSVSGADEASRVFAALSDGGNVQMPLSKTFFSPCFGTVTDRFGVKWMVIVPQA